jgi:hypothetical protein
METGSIITIVAFVLIFIVGFAFCFMNIGKGGGWGD